MKTITQKCSKVKALFSKLWYWYYSYISSNAVATICDIKEHFSLTDGEMEMLDAAVKYKLLKEYVTLTEDKTAAYIVVSVKDCMGLVRKRRRNVA